MNRVNDKDDRSRYWEGKVLIMRMNLGLADGKFGKIDFRVLGVERTEFKRLGLDNGKG